MRRAGAEFTGAYGIVTAGCGAIVVNTLTGSLGHVGVALTFGLTVAVMIAATGHLSGAHFNPAVTVAFAVTRHFPWREVPVYVAGQLLGAVAGALTGVAGTASAYVYGLSHLNVDGLVFTGTPTTGPIEYTFRLTNTATLDSTTFPAKVISSRASLASNRKRGRQSATAQRTPTPTTAMTNCWTTSAQSEGRMSANVIPATAPDALANVVRNASDRYCI